MRVFEGSAYGSLESFTLVERELPIPAEGQVRIRIQATGLGFVDGLIVQGRYQIKPPLPYVPGGEIAGVVDATGAGVHRLKVGDQVATWQMGGGLAEYVVAAEDEVDLVPTGLDPATVAAMLIDYQTAHYALCERARLRAGETVLVTGAAGGVGSAAIQIARDAGANVIAAASTEEKRNRAKGLGAAVVVDSTAEDLRGQLRSIAPKGVDVVVDPVGGRNFEVLFRSLAKEGRHLVIGFAGGDIPKLPTNLSLLKSADLLGVDLRHFIAVHPEAAHRARAMLYEKVASGVLAGPWIAPFPLTQAHEALEATSWRSKSGKTVVLPALATSEGDPSIREVIEYRP